MAAMAIRPQPQVKITRVTRVPCKTAAGLWITTRVERVLPEREFGAEIRALQPLTGLRFRLAIRLGLQRKGAVRNCLKSQEHRGLVALGIDEADLEADEVETVTVGVHDEIARDRFAGIQVGGFAPRFGGAGEESALAQDRLAGTREAVGARRGGAIGGRAFARWRAAGRRIEAHPHPGDVVDEAEHAHAGLADVLARHGGADGHVPVALSCPNEARRHRDGGRLQGRLDPGLVDEGVDRPGAGGEDRQGLHQGIGTLQAVAPPGSRSLVVPLHSRSRSPRRGGKRAGAAKVPWARSLPDNRRPDRSARYRGRPTETRNAGA
ncbi:MAG: hypothetical protein EOO66_31365, partial [Methylobacterium sp.]